MSGGHFELSSVAPAIQTEGLQAMSYPGKNLDETARNGKFADNLDAQLAQIEAKMARGQETSHVASVTRSNKGSARLM